MEFSELLLATRVCQLMMHLKETKDPRFDELICVRMGTGCDIDDLAERTSAMRATVTDYVQEKHPDLYTRFLKEQH